MDGTAALKKQRTTNIKRRERSRVALLASAEKMFVKKGFHRTTIDDIAAGAELTKGSIYFHFKDKHQLLLSLLERADARVMKPILAGMKDQSISPKARIIQFLNSWALAAAAQRNTMFLPILMSFEFLDDDGEIAKHIGRSYDRAYATLEKVFEEGQADGSIPDSNPPREQAAILIALADGMLLEWLRRADHFDGVSASQAIRSLVMSGLSFPDDEARELSLVRKVIPFASH